MKRFILSVLAVAIFFVGVGALVQNTGAKFKSDEKALALIQKARKAIGGDSAINSIQSMRIVGRSAKTFKADGALRTTESETEIALQLPDMVVRSVNFVGGNDANGKSVERRVDVEVTGTTKDGNVTFGRGEGRGLGVSSANGEKKVVLQIDENGVKKELTGEEAEKWIAAHQGDVEGAHKIMLHKTDGNGPGEKNAVIQINENGVTRELTGADAEKWMAEHGDKVGGGGRVLLRKTDGTVEEGGREQREVVIRRGDGEKTEFRTEGGKMMTGEGNHLFLTRAEGGPHQEAMMKHNEMTRFALGLLLSAPQGTDVNYTLGGEGNVDGAACNIVNAELGGQTYKLYLDKSSNLPVMLSYTGIREPQVMTFTNKVPTKSGEPVNDTMVFSRKVEGPPVAPAEISIRYSDYRTVNGVLLPYHWTQTVGGETDETFDVTSYEINPANIAEKFQNQGGMMRMKKPGN